MRMGGYGMAAALTALLAGGAALAQGTAEARIETIPVRDGVHMLAGRGGNIGVSVGPDGVLLVDDQFAVMTDKIVAAVGKLSDEPIRFVINTHWHGDHVGGNENLGKLGSIIVAHDNVRRRMSSEHFNEFFDRRTPASPDGALPVVTFPTEVTFHWNDETIHVFHVGAAHTDGDAIVHFEGADVLHTGDVFFSGMYPFIDVSSGGSIDGLIAAVDTLLALADDRTRIIPGHGPVSSRADLASYRAMLAGVRAKVAALVESGASLDEARAAEPTAEYDERWGGGFIGPEQMTSIVYASLSGS